ncbi:cbb3-type cytochrome oxidase assembly protein CcoS [Nodularia spumigena]|uniref:cbb3-type cytochrome oxidase assembly protein CcoS n=1 Tax=Nodularia spumigena TaxID=70799 RepID=UPI002B22022B|nr:cbb3-type cytochrome oxidase assembly protein CcoS [Nodularia spumigena]MEA5556243.1 cbb3-type cytochrome oxidase assembly protein CcoS [Nodularia spumigena CH309]
MTVLYIVLPLAVLLAACAVIGFIWAARQGQLDDLETPALRVVTDDDAGSGAWTAKAPTHPGPAAAKQPSE